MNAPLPTPDIITNTAWQQRAGITLSVLIPFYNDDPQTLLHQLGRNLPAQCEIIFYNDGSDDPLLRKNMSTAVSGLSLPVQLINGAVNRGRSAARNALIKAARGQWVLFLDADMMPEDENFLQNWCDCIAQQNPAIVFGGFSVETIESIEPALALHQAFSQSSDCLPAQVRAVNPAKHVCTSNLLVRRDVLHDCPFDNGFSGWGWEDVEWAARASKTWSVSHIDNPARHLGLESADTLVRRFKQSAPNYARFVQQHPALAQTLPSWKAAQMIRKIPGVSVFLPVFAVIARDKVGVLPLWLRVLALKLWRSCWYAQALS